MDKYSPFYQDPKYRHDVTKLSDQALEERLIFIRNISYDERISASTVLDLDKYYKEYYKEWERRRLETNHNHNRHTNRAQN